jgi:hypothetical protein
MVSVLTQTVSFTVIHADGRIDNADYVTLTRGLLIPDRQFRWAARAEPSYSAGLSVEGHQKQTFRRQF